MSSRWRAALVGALLVAGLVTPGSTLASDTVIPSCTDPQAFGTNEDVVLNDSVTCAGVEAGDTFDLVTDVSDGTLSLDPDGSFTYDPNPDFNGSDQFTFKVSDPDGDSATVSADITVDPVNDPPSFTKGPDDSTPENSGSQTVAGWATNIKKGPPDESSQTLTFVITGDTDASLFSTLPAVSANGTLTYTPATNASGTAAITLHLEDNGGGDDSSPNQSFHITITGVNQPPSFTVGPNRTDLEDAGPQSVTNWATDISPGPPDESGQTVSFVIDGDTNPSLFSVDPDVSPSGKLTYTPAANANGSANITLHAQDDGGTTGGGEDTSDPQTFTITVTAVNDAPSFTKGGDQTVLEGAGAQTVNNWATNISKGPPNESAQTLTFHVSNDDNALFSVQPAINSAGTLIFTPAPSENGSATVSVYLQDSGGTANTGDDTSPTVTFTITLTGVNDPPSFVKGPDESVLEDSGAHSFPGWATSISPGPPDESGQTVTFVLDSDTPDLFSSGPVVSSTGTLTFTPGPNLNSSSTVVLHAVDDGGTSGGGSDTSAPQTFNITITPVNDPPSFTKGSNQTVAEDSGTHTVPNWAINISKGPADESAQLVDFVMVSDTNPALFTVAPAVSPTGTLTYTLAPDANGSASIGLHIHDNGGTANNGDDTGSTTTFTINVSVVNDPPTCANDSNATFVNSALNASITSCADVDGDTLIYSKVSDPTHGTVSVSSNGSYTYTPTTSFQGTDSFVFKANDGTVDSTTTGTMSILVSPDPIARNDVAPTDFPPIVQGSGPTAIPVLANDLDKQGGPLFIQSVTQGAKGKVVMTGGGTGLTYDPIGLATGTDSFRYTIIDSQSRTNSAIVVVIISPDKTRPVTTAPLTSIAGGTLGASTAKVRISWTASDVGTGVKSIQLQESVDGGTFHTVALPSLRTTSLVRSVLVFHTYRYRVRATDVVGNVGIYAAGTPFRMSRYQESFAAVSYAGHWASAVSTAYSGGRSRWSTGAGTSVTFAFSGGTVAWVSARGPSRGSVQVFVDGVLVRTISLYRSTNLYRQVVFSARFSTVGPHTLTIVNLRTAGHPRIDADAFLLTR